jgi:hypothetical protein
VLKLIALDGAEPVNMTIYTWFQIGEIRHHRRLPGRRV